MRDEHFYDTDGKLLFVPQQGAVQLWIEFGIVDASPGEIAILPRGIKFRVEVPGGPTHGYVCETYGGTFTLPERGPIGTNCLANPRDFLTRRRRALASAHVCQIRSRKPLWGWLGRGCARPVPYLTSSRCRGDGSSSPDRRYRNHAQTYRPIQSPFSNTLLYHPAIASHLDVERVHGCPNASTSSHRLGLE